MTKKTSSWLLPVEPAIGKPMPPWCAGGDLESLFDIRSACKFYADLGGR
jgi:hypothetical protein